MRIEPEFICFSKADNKSFPGGIIRSVDTYCYLPTPATVSVANNVNNYLQYFQFAKQLVDPSALYTINTV